MDLGYLLFLYLLLLVSPSICIRPQLITSTCIPPRDRLSKYYRNALESHLAQRTSLRIFILSSIHPCGAARVKYCN